MYIYDSISLNDQWRRIAQETKAHVGLYRQVMMMMMMMMISLNDSQKQECFM